MEFSGTRMDPTDGGKIYAFKDLLQRFKGEYNKADIEAYWRLVLKPVPGHHAAAKVKETNGHPVEFSGTRMDPTDKGRIYTFEQLVQRFKCEYEQADIEAYWRLVLKPVSENYAAQAEQAWSASSHWGSGWSPGWTSFRIFGNGKRRAKLTMPAQAV